jgi:protein-disulfide isomerase
MEETQRASWFTTPVAVLIGAALIAVSIMAVGSGNGLALIKGDESEQPTETPPIVVDAEKIATSDDPSIGNDDAPVTIVEFSDFQCPFCGRFFSETYGQLKKDYIDTGKVRLIFRDFPLQFHQAAEISARAGECAQDQGKFFEFHDRVFIEQAKLGIGTVEQDADTLKAWAKTVGMNVTEFGACLDSGKYADEVAADLADGSAAGVTGTPFFFVNGTPVEGAVPIAVFKAAIDAALE